MFLTTTVTKTNNQNAEFVNKLGMQNCGLTSIKPVLLVYSNILEKLSVEFYFVFSV